MRRLHSGTILKIYVTKPGFIGKYTRLRVTNKGVPLRVDRCAKTPDTKPHKSPRPDRVPPAWQARPRAALAPQAGTCDLLN